MAAAIHLSLNDTRRAIQKLLLSNNAEFAFVLANVFDKDCLDQVLTFLFQKVVCFRQMSITNSILNQIKNKNLKEVLELCLYSNEDASEIIMSSRTAAQ